MSSDYKRPGYDERSRERNRSRARRSARPSGDGASGSSRAPAPGSRSGAGGSRSGAGGPHSGAGGAHPTTWQPDLEQRQIIEAARNTEELCQTNALLERVIDLMGGGDGGAGGGGIVGGGRRRPSAEDTRPIEFSGSNYDGILLGENPARLGYKIYNDGSVPLYVLTSAEKASKRLFTLLVQPGEFYETLFLAADTYAGEIRYCWGDAAQVEDRAMVTEVYVDETAAPVLGHTPSGDFSRPPFRF